MQDHILKHWDNGSLLPCAEGPAAAARAGRRQLVFCNKSINVTAKDRGAEFTSAKHRAEGSLATRISASGRSPQPGPGGTVQGRAA